ncbi:MAG TPA: hypothetical protein VF787_16665 [Thermoanaerobaculia bacterium]
MELDDLKARWQDLDRKLDATLHLNTRLVRNSMLGRTESALRNLTWITSASIAMTFFVLLAIGSFLADHILEVRFAAPALVLHISAIAMFAASIHELVTLRSVDYSAPVVSLQKKIETVRVSRIATTKWVLWLAPLLWLPMLIVFLKAILGIDLYAIASPAWLISNFVFGVLFLVAMIWIARHVPVQSPFMQRLLDDIAGRNVTRARAALEDVAAFERDNV